MPYGVGIAVCVFDIDSAAVPISAGRGTPSVYGVVGMGLESLCEALTIVIPECACYARPERGVVRRPKSIIQFQLETAVHATDYIFH